MDEQSLIRDPLNQELDNLRVENAKLLTERNEISKALSCLLDDMEGLLEACGISRNHPTRAKVRWSRDELLKYIHD